MDIIPVIDLKGGVVVRAERGVRQSYAPIKTRLAPSSRPADVVAGFLSLYNFQTIYVADLDAIEKRGSHQNDIFALEAAFPNVAFWIDAGVGDQEAADILLATSRSALVLGSENLPDLALCAAQAENPRVLLSLDFRGETFQGPAALLHDPSSWPGRVIVMTLARVGSNEGPDLARLEDIVAKAGPARSIYAAGGLRGSGDLDALSRIGVRGVLVASALHDGRLDRETLARWCRPT
jgi:phosphoribosylformimino-5-aminoimidazole carboxamide ribotide isomerase